MTEAVQPLSERRQRIVAALSANGVMTTLGVAAAIKSPHDVWLIRDDLRMLHSAGLVKTRWNGAMVCRCSDCSLEYRQWKLSRSGQAVADASRRLA